AREQVLVGRAGPHAVAPLVVAQHAPAVLLDDVVVPPVVRRRRKRLGGSVPEGGHALPPSAWRGTAPVCALAHDAIPFVTDDSIALLDVRRSPVLPAL